MFFKKKKSDNTEALQKIKTIPLSDPYFNPFRLDIEVAKEAIKYSNYHNLNTQHIDPQLKENKEIALLILDRGSVDDVVALFGSNSLKDKNVAMIAVTKTPNSYFWIGEELQQDEEIITQLLTTDARRLYVLPEEHRNNKQFALIACENYGFAYDSLNKTLKEDIEVAITAVRNDPDVFSIVTTSLKDNKEVLLAAMESAKENPKKANCYYTGYLNLASKRLQAEYDFEEDILGKLRIDVENEKLKNRVNDLSKDKSSQLNAL